MLSPKVSLSIEGHTDDVHTLRELIDSLPREVNHRVSVSSQVAGYQLFGVSLDEVSVDQAKSVLDLFGSPDA